MVSHRIQSELRETNDSIFINENRITVDNLGNHRKIYYMSIIFCQIYFQQFDMKTAKKYVEVFNHFHGKLIFLFAILTKIINFFLRK